MFAQIEDNKMEINIQFKNGSTKFDEFAEEAIRSIRVLDKRSSTIQEKQEAFDNFKLQLSKYLDEVIDETIKKELDKHL